MGEGSRSEAGTERRRGGEHKPAKRRGGGGEREEGVAHTMVLLGMG
jgi:hypothetical protein